MPTKTVTRCVPQPTAKMSVSEGVSQMWVFYDSGTPIRSFHFSEKNPRNSMILHLENSGEFMILFTGVS